MKQTASEEGLTSSKEKKKKVMYTLSLYSIPLYLCRSHEVTVIIGVYALS